MNLYISSEHDVVLADTFEEARGLLDRQRADGKEDAKPVDFVLEQFDLRTPRVIMFEGSKDFAAVAANAGGMAVYDKAAIDRANNVTGGAPPAREPSDEPKLSPEDQAAKDKEAREAYLVDHPGERRDDEITSDKQRAQRDAANKAT